MGLGGSKAETPRKVTMLVPMAGAGSRFAKNGYTAPKPLIDVDGKPMIKWVVDNVKAQNVELQFVFVIQEAHERDFGIATELRAMIPGVKIVYVDKLTEGAACTCLLAEKHIDNADELVIVNSDQFIEWDAATFYRAAAAPGVDGAILTFTVPMHLNDVKWSYAKLDKEGKVVDVQEKKVISEHATVGLYHWSRGSDFVKDAKAMIAKGIRVNGEYYVCPVYNEGIARGQKYVIQDCTKMWGLGVPEDLQEFLTSYIPSTRGHVGACKHAPAKK